jgi:hypothetical protein
MRTFKEAKMRRHWVNITFCLFGAAAILVISGATSCSSECSSADSTINARDYDRNCTTDADCIVIHEGDMCLTSCEKYCGNAAISISDQARYERDRADNIGVGDFGGAMVCESCPYNYAAFCDAGACSIH